MFTLFTGTMPKSESSYQCDDSLLPPKKRRLASLPLRYPENGGTSAAREPTRFSIKPTQTTKSGSAEGAPLRFTSQQVQQLLDRNAVLMQEWARQSRWDSRVSIRARKQPNGLCCSIDDGAIFFPYATGNVEIEDVASLALQ